MAMPLRATMSVAQERAKWCRSHAGDGVGYGDWVGGPEMMSIDDGAHMKTGKRDNKMGSNGLGVSLDIRIIGDVAIPVHWDYCVM